MAAKMPTGCLLTPDSTYDNFNPRSGVYFQRVDGSFHMYCEFPRSFFLDRSGLYNYNQLPKLLWGEVTTEKGGLRPIFIKPDFFKLGVCPKCRGKQDGHHKIADCIYKDACPYCLHNIEEDWMDHFYSEKPETECPVLKILKQNGFTLPNTQKQDLATDPGASFSIMGAQALAAEGPGPIRRRPRQDPPTRGSHQHTPLSPAQKRAALRARFM